MDASSFITNLYGDILDRAPAPSEHSGWIGRLNAGESPHQVARTFVLSDENLGKSLDEAYQEFLGRRPRADEKAEWIARIRQGTSLVDAHIAILSSDEYNLRHGNEQFVTQLYRDVLGRDPEPGVIVAWMNRFASGESRNSVASSFVRSPEAVGQVIDSFYQDYLRRPSEEWGLNLWRAKVLSGRNNYTEIAVGILGSIEYFNFPVFGRAGPAGGSQGGDTGATLGGLPRKPELDERRGNVWFRNDSDSPQVVLLYNLNVAGNPVTSTTILPRQGGYIGTDVVTNQTAIRVGDGPARLLTDVSDWKAFRDNNKNIINRYFDVTASSVSNGRHPIPDYKGPTETGYVTELSFVNDSPAPQRVRLYSAYAPQHHIHEQVVPVGHTAWLDRGGVPDNYGIKAGYSRIVPISKVGKPTEDARGSRYIIIKASDIMDQL